MKKLLVLGATGFIGGSLVRYFTARGYEVYGTMRKIPPSDPHQILKSIKYCHIGDLENSVFLDGVLSIDYDAILFTISLNHRDTDKNYLHALKINVGILLGLIECLIRKDKKTKIVYFSTFQVYGHILENSTFSEADQVNPGNLYGLTHLMCESILKAFVNQKKIKANAIRLTNSYGPPPFPSCDVMWLVINDLINGALNHGIISLQSDGSPSRNFIYIDDVLSACELVMKSSDENGFVFNVGAPNSLSIGEMAIKISDILGQKLGVNIPVFRSDGALLEFKQVDNSNIFNLDTQKIKSLGFAPEIDIQEGLKRTTEYFILKKDK